jgi:hypothetical protein
VTDAAYLILAGASDWQQPGWRGCFYPDDLPDDWQLPFYATRFQAVYLPAARWQTVSADTWARWLDDTPPGFVFVLEPGVGTEAGFPPCVERVIMATPEWSASHVWWLDEAPDLRALADRASTLASRGESLVAISRTGNLAALEQVNTLRQVLGY